MLFPHLGDLLRCEMAGQSIERGPQPSMNEGQLSVDEAADEHFVGFRYRAQRGIDVLAFGQSPPAAFEWPAQDGLDQTRLAPFGGDKDNAALSDEGQSVFGGETKCLAHGD